MLFRRPERLGFKLFEYCVMLGLARPLGYTDSSLTSDFQVNC